MFNPPRPTCSRTFRPTSWHNVFRCEVTQKVDDSVFEPLFKEGGRPNAPLRILLAMIVLKEDNVCEDAFVVEGIDGVLDTEDADRKTAHIVSKDGHVEHWINVTKPLEDDRYSPEFRKLVQESKYRDWPNFGELELCNILLQHYGNLVSFKNVKIKPLN